MATAVAPHIPEKKKLHRRAAPDRSQTTRHWVQGAFIVLNAFIGIQFYLWVLYYERGGTGLYVSRPAGAEGWLPIAGLMNLKYFAMTGHVPQVHPAAMYLLGAFLLMSILLKKAFCSWLCPVGNFYEILYAIGRRVFRRSNRQWRWEDIAHRSLKYILLGVFAAAVACMTAAALEAYMQTPYGLLADVKMLNFFRDLSLTAIVVLGLLMLLSMLVENFWCRYLCPYGALMGLVSFFSPVKIRRDAEACIDCGKCAKVCPAALKVDQLIQIRSVECSACLQCVAACPAEDALQFALPPRPAATPAQRWYRRTLSPAAVTCIIAYLFFGMVLVARATGHWKTDLPRDVYMQLVPRANSLTHPGM